MPSREGIRVYSPCGTRGQATALRVLTKGARSHDLSTSRSVHTHSRGPQSDRLLDLPYAKDRYTREADRLLGVLDERLKDRKYVAGEYSIADMAIYPWVRRILERFEGFENVWRWTSRIAERPAIIRAYEKGAAINTVPTITEESKALLLGLSGGDGDDRKDYRVA